MADDSKERRKRMVERLEDYSYIESKKVKKAMVKVDRKDFVLPEHRNSAYEDTPLPIPADSTISAPHMHAIFLEAAKLEKGERVLEIGAGSGILLAYAKEIVGKKGEVVGTEIKQEVYRFAKNNMEKAGYDDKVKLVYGDIENIPGRKKFDKILVSATAPTVPEPLLEKLRMGGMMIVPVGRPYGKQELIAVKKTKEKPLMKSLGSVVFVPLIGEHGWED